MKRYKVVQDANGHWGIWDTAPIRTARVFASWGDRGYTGSDNLDGIVTWAARLNEGINERREFVWSLYTPRKENR